MINGPYQTGLTLAEPPWPTPPQVTGRRSLAQASARGETVAFRRVDLAPDQPKAGLGQPQPSQPQPSRPVQARAPGTPDESGQHPAPRGARDGPPARETGREAPASQRPPPTTPPVRDHDADGLPRPVTAGRTALLAGRAGVMAQLFGQDPGRPSAADGGRPGADRGRSEDAPPPPPPLSRLEVDVALRTYQTANRAVGTAGFDDDQGTGARFEVLLEAAPARGPALEVVA